jgi:hypothetical protein
MRRLCLAFLILLCAGLEPLPLSAAEEVDERSVLLIASEDMADPRFRQSVVLVTRHGRGNSPLGVIVNRPLQAGLDRIFPELKQAGQHRLHYGGPVAPGRIVFMLRGEAAPEAAITVATRPLPRQQHRKPAAPARGADAGDPAAGLPRLRQLGAVSARKRDRSRRLASAAGRRRCPVQRSAGRDVAQAVAARDAGHGAGAVA